MHCSNCHGTDHNIRKCRHAPILNGRQQRAQDRESSTSSRGSRSDNDELNLQKSHLDSDNLQDLQFQAEMERYDTIKEKSREIIDRRRVEWDLESQSELSVLASSQFDGMDGIESSQGIGVKLGDVELGGTSGGLADQDAQNNIQNIQGSQDSQGSQIDSIDNANGQVSGGLSVQGAGTSPKRTRPGKVKYRGQ